jgi:hypothetical protein
MSLNSGRDGQYGVEKIIPFPIIQDSSYKSNIKN